MKSYELHKQTYYNSSWNEEKEKHKTEGKKIILTEKTNVRVTLTALSLCHTHTQQQQHQHTGELISARNT